MKSRLVRKIAVVAVITSLIFGETLTAIAETVSGGDAVVESEETVVEEQPEMEVQEEVTLEETEQNDAEVVEDTLVEEVEIVEEIEEVEEVTEETVSGGDVLVEETVSGGDLVIIEDEEVALADMPEVEFEETVNGVTICVTVAADAFEEGTEMVVEEVDPVQAVIEKAEKEKNAVVQMCRSFDITFVKDGEEVQPANGRTIEVTFEGEMILPGDGEEVAVYHVDKEDVITDIEAVVVEDEEDTKAGTQLKTAYTPVVNE